MISNEQAVFNAMKKTWGDQLPPELTAENLEFSNLRSEYFGGSADIMVDGKIVAKEQRWKKAPATTAPVLGTNRSHYDISTDLYEGTPLCIEENDTVLLDPEEGIIFILASSEAQRDIILKNISDNGQVAPEVYPDGLVSVDDDEYVTCWTYYSKDATPFRVTYPLRVYLTKKTRYPQDIGQLDFEDGSQ